MAQAYDSTKAVVAQMRPTPSALYNNLTLAGASSLFYVHNCSPCMVTPVHVTTGKPAEVRRMDTKNQDTIYCVKSFTHDDNSYLLIGTDGGLQIWDKTGGQLMHTWAFGEADRAPDATHATFVRGISVNMAADGTPNICFGTSLGNLHVIQLGPGKAFSAPNVFAHHKSPITCMSSSFQTRQGRWSDDMGCKLVTCDEAGEIVVWEGLSAESYKLCLTVPSTGVPTSSVAVRNDFIIAARLDGAVQIYGMNDGKLRGEVISHSRWLTAMDIHPAKDIIATVSEDCTINVWTLPIGAQKATSLLSATWNNSILTGVAFCGATFDEVAVVAADLDEIRIYKPARPT